MRVGRSNERFVSVAARARQSQRRRAATGGEGEAEGVIPESHAHNQQAFHHRKKMLLAAFSSTSQGLIVAPLRSTHAAPSHVRMASMDKYTEGTDSWWGSAADKFTAGVTAGGYNVRLHMQCLMMEGRPLTVCVFVCARAYALFSSANTLASRSPSSLLSIASTRSVWWTLRTWLK